MPTPSQVPAHQTWIELKTRITSQDLHFRSGREEAALESVVEVFRKTRELMKSSPGADDFLPLADVLLKTIRPYTARWHSLVGEDKLFVGPAARRQFRQELLQLQATLSPLTELFEALAKGDRIEVPPAPSRRTASLGAVAVPMGIGKSRSRPVNAGDIDAAEAAHVARRRGTDPVAQLFDGAALALSGGGIRSATFCLGVVQVLAEKRLLAGFDYISTVSGGGYLGSFLSNQFTDNDPAADRFGEEFAAHNAESAPVRHLRNSSKYLLPKTTLSSLRLAGQLLSGIVATTLLMLVVPVVAASFVRCIAHFIGFGEEVRQAFLAAAAACAAIVAACWLLRPLNWIGRHSKGHLDTIAANFGVGAAVALCMGITPRTLEWLRHWDWQIVGVTAAGAATLISGSLVVRAMQSAWKYRRALSRLFMLSGIILFTIIYLWLVDALGLERVSQGLTTGEVWVICSLVLWVLWAFSINLNETGLHRYYRDRLAECYLDAQASFRTAANPPPLSELSDRLPYHLINTTVNLTSSDSPELRGRGGDFFLLSKYYCGSPLLKYKRTDQVVKENPDLDLATAMAVSGAAASTNMGWQTMREYRTLMAIFNVRLGYWMKWREEGGILRSNAFVQVMREVFGRLDERSTAINLSDGGHIENLAVYELIRRKMRFIVCVDGGMDGEMTCADLSRLQRLVAIDFGYRIEFDARNLKPRNKVSAAYGLMVKIDYTPGEREHKELGWMLYIKLAMMGTEANYVLDYQRENPFFPHQTTADQFFDEAQFEAYRKLGETAATSFFSAPFSAPTPDQLRSGGGFRPWFDSLAQSLLPDTDPVFQ